MEDNLFSFYGSCLAGKRDRGRGFLSSPYSFRSPRLFLQDYSLIGSLWVPPVLYEQRLLFLHAKHLSPLPGPFASSLPFFFRRKHFGTLVKQFVCSTGRRNYLPISR